MALDLASVVSQNVALSYPWGFTKQIQCQSFSEDVSSKMSLIITDDADKRPSLAENVEIRMGIKPEVQEYIRLIPYTQNNDQKNGSGKFRVKKRDQIQQNYFQTFSPFNYSFLAKLAHVAQFDKTSGAYPYIKLGIV